jgi:rod shape determining protein RodA
MRANWDTSSFLHLDLPLLFGLFALCGIGLVLLYSASGADLDTVTRQAMRMGMGFVILIVLAQFRVQQISRWIPWMYGGGVFLLVAVLLIGDIAMGAQRWLDLGVIRFQPSEIMKIIMPLTLAWFLSQRALPPSYPRLAVAAVLILLPTLLIAKQPDLGTSLLVAASGTFVVLLSGVSWRLVAALGALGASATVPLWYMLHDYQRQRVLTLFDPEADPLGTGYHIIQSKIAIGSGGLYGKGWLNGTQSHLEFLPERSTDFIFAVYSEEFGLIGIVLLLIVYMLIITRGLYLTMHTQGTFGRLLSGSLMLTFFVYIFVNIGMVIGILPVVGVPLPLLSYGGTALVTLLSGFGLVMGAYTHRRLLSG